jgi:16S rRNA (cytosine1402-N4)-methyltransferase
MKKRYPHKENPSMVPVAPGSYHTPVLLQEAVGGLHIQEKGIYVDCTFGGGGHSREIMSRLGSEGKLFVFDQDAESIRNAWQDPRLHFLPHNFRHLQRFLRLHQVTKVDGILADLGVSSHQLDEPERGFSTRFDGALDMRMDKRQELTASRIISSYSEARLHKLFEKYGEVSNAKTLARSIAQNRGVQRLHTVAEFRSALGPLVKGNPHKWFAQVFQALRIEVNDEMGALKDLLEEVPDLLEKGGRIAVISFHSLEDRMVKNFFRTGTFEEPTSNPYEQVQKNTTLRAMTKKPIVPGEAERRLNPRARSAKLRIAERI